LPIERNLFIAGLPRPFHGLAMTIEGVFLADRGISGLFAY